MPTLHNLQLFLIPHTDSVSRSANTSARLYFLAGPRLITYLSATHNLLTNASSVLSCGAPLVPERVSQVVEERKKAEKRVVELEVELAGLIVKDLVKRAEAHYGTSDTEKIFTIHLHRNDDTLSFLNTIAFGFSNEWLAGGSASKPYMIVLSSSPTSQTGTSTSLVIVVGSDDKKVKEFGGNLKSIVGVKGGGMGNKYSGKFVGVWKGSKEGAGIDELLQKL